MSFIARNRKKGWTRTTPDASMVHPDIDCSEHSIKHIYNNWVQPGTTEKKYDRLCEKPAATVIGMKSGRSRLLKHTANQNRLNNNPSTWQNAEYTNFIAVTTAKDSNTDDECCKPEQSHTVKKLTKTYEDYISERGELETHRSSIDCCKPFPYDVNKKTKNELYGSSNVEQGYLDYHYYGTPPIWDFSVNTLEDTPISIDLSYNCLLYTSPSPRD